jgi:hypothetical protein
MFSTAPSPDADAPSDPLVQARIVDHPYRDFTFVLSGPYSEGKLSGFQIPRVKECAFLS